MTEQNETTTIDLKTAPRDQLAEALEDAALNVTMLNEQINEMRGEFENARDELRTMARSMEGLAFMFESVSRAYAGSNPSDVTTTDDPGIALAWTFKDLSERVLLISESF